MRHIALSALLAAGLALPALAEDVTIATAQGEVTLAAAPQRIAAYDVAAIDALHALGVDPVAVPDNVFVSYLAEVAANATKVGTLFEPNLEALAGVGPDLVIVGGRSATQREAVAQVAPAIDMTIGPDLVGDVRARVTAYGTLLGKEAEAEALVAALDDRLAAVAAAGEGKGRALIVLTNGPKLSAYGHGSRFGWILDVTGLQDVAGEFAPAEGETGASHGNSISHEYIAEHDPDWLIVLDRGAAIGEDGPSAAATLANPLVEGTTAWQKGQVIYLSPAVLYIAAGGPEGLMLLLDELAAGLAG